MLVLDNKIGTEKVRKCQSRGGNKLSEARVISTNQNFEEFL